jgi:hypothetical protein
MSPAVFEPVIPASERPQTHGLDRAATGTLFLFEGFVFIIPFWMFFIVIFFSVYYVGINVVWRNAAGRIIHSFIQYYV